MMKDLADKTVVIAALARNCAKQLPNNIRRIEELRCFFSKSYVIVIENDSKDATKEILKNWKKKAVNVYVISNDFQTDTIPVRTRSLDPGTSAFRIEKMARYRNMYMDFIDSLGFPIDYVLMLDIDINYFSVMGVVDSILKAPLNWSALFAYGIANVCYNDFPLFPCYYDCYAFVPVNRKKYELSSDNFLLPRKYVFGRIAFTKYLSCSSAFGGIGIYKYKLISGKRYCCQENPAKNSMECLCEHVSFNCSLIDSIHMNYISRSMKVKYQEKVTFQSFISLFIPCWIKRIIKCKKLK